MLGLIGAAARGAGGNFKTEGGVVRLPPFAVEHSRGSAWRYVELPGVEVLARCNDETTERLALTFHRAQGLLDLILPGRFQLRFEVPQTLIFYDRNLWPAARLEMVAEITRLHPGFHIDELEEAAPPTPADDLVPNAYPPGLEVRSRGTSRKPQTAFFTNLQLTDADSAMTFAMVSGGYVDPSQSRLTFDYVSELVDGRVPSLPDWFRSGFLGIYPLLRLGERTISLSVPVFASLADAPPTPDGLIAPGDGMLPLDKLFQPMPTTSDADLVTWMEEAKLFVCWGIDPAGKRTEAFWQFLDECSHGQTPSEAFQACFGMSAAEGGKQLAAYDREPHKLRWSLDDRYTELPACTIRDASRDEVARIKGEWERLETRYVRENLPDLEDAYRAEALRTLHRAYDAGGRDPRLLASLGLLEVDAAEPRNALPFLEAAAAKGVVRPRVFFELARIRYDEALDRSKRNDGKLDAGQADSILKLLEQASRQAPPLRPVFELMADVGVNSTAPIPPEASAELLNGMNLFPDDLALLLRVARLLPTGALQQRADELIRRRTQAAAGSEARDKLPKPRFDLGSVPSPR